MIDVQMEWWKLNAVIVIKITVSLIVLGNIPNFV